MKWNIEQVLYTARLSGLAHNGGAGGEYIMCGTEAELLKFVDMLLTQKREKSGDDDQCV